MKNIGSQHIESVVVFLRITCPVPKKSGLRSLFFKQSYAVYPTPTTRLFNTKVTLLNPENLKAKWVNHEKHYY